VFIDFHERKELTKKGWTHVDKLANKTWRNSPNNPLPLWKIIVIVVGLRTYTEILSFLFYFFEITDFWYFFSFQRILEKSWNK